MPNQTPQSSPTSDALGKVSLVGAGPGDPGLITVKGLESLRTADAVVFDRLASPRLLAEARLDAELYDAGKRRDDHQELQKAAAATAFGALRAVRVCRLDAASGE